MRSVFITGTGTGVGKTIISTILLSGDSSDSGLYYWKPLQTGSPPDDDTRSVRMWTGLPESRFLKPYRVYSDALSPHHASELAGEVIDYDELLKVARNHLDNHPVLMEGAGGILVPINRKRNWLNLIQDTQLPVIIASSTGLGTINHTLLTIEALFSRGIEIIGVMYLGDENEDNRRTIHEISCVADLGRIEIVRPDLFEKDFQSAVRFHPAPE